MVYFKYKTKNIDLIKYVNGKLVDFIQGSWSTKIRPQAIIDNFAFKNSNIIIEGLFWKRKEKNLKYRKIILLINFIFAPTFLLIASWQTLKNYAILINYK